MKKIIITASMLAAAGTAFASEIVTDDLLSVFGESTSSTVVYKNFTSGITASSISSWLSGTPAGTLYTTNKKGDNSYPPGITLMAEEDGDYSLGNSWIYYACGGNVYGLTTSLTDYTTTSSISFSWTYNGTSNTASLSEATIAIVYQTSDGSWDMSSNSVTSLVVGDSLSVSTADGLALGGSTVYAVLFAQTSAGATINTSEISLTATYTAIPEPSAFGLLAGVGALALVALRRRRSK